MEVSRRPSGGAGLVPTAGSDYGAGVAKARDERTVLLLGELCARAHASSPQRVKGALSRSVGIIAAENEGESEVAQRAASSSLDSFGMEASIAASVQRQLVRTGKRDEATGLPLSVKFAELHERLSRKGLLRRYGSLLRLLNQLSGHWTDLDGSHGPNPTAASGAGNTMVPFKVIGGEGHNHPHLPRGGHQAERAAIRKLKYFRIKERDDFQSLHERDLVRDVLFVAQGIDGKFVKFSASEDRYRVADEYVVSAQARELVANLCEVGWLYRRLQGLAEAHEAGDGTDPKGSTQQAFFSAVRGHLAHYYRMLALVESRVMSSSAGGAEHGEGGLIEREVGGLRVSLRSLAIMLSEPTQQLRVLAILCDGVEGLKGGALVNRLFKMAKHGDPHVRGLVGGILHEVCRPLFRMVSRWMFEGELHDPCGEFFIREEEGVPLDDLWRHGYKLRSEMIPSAISGDLARTILRTGKSINFLKRCCEVKEWGDFHSLSREAEASLRFGAGEGGGGDAEGIERFVAKVAKRVDSHVMHTLFYTFRCGDHLQAVKRYLLLGQGDFIQQLMDLSGEDLNEKAGTVSAYQLGSTLETAIRSSVVQFDDPEILDCLRVEMMPHASEEYGWDVFSLNYVVRSPLTCVLTDDSMRKYLRVFNFLWRLKRVEHALCQVWQQMKPSVQLFGGVRNEDGENVVGIKGEVRRCHCVRNEMSHFCMNLQYYIMFEVLEEGWTEFKSKMEAAEDLDALISAHDVYLDGVVEKALLGERSQALVRQLNLVFDLIMRFQGFSARIQEILKEASQKRRLRTLRAEVETAQGNWGVDGEGAGELSGQEDVDCFPERFLYSTRYELDAIKGDYKVLVDGFLKLFPTVPHLDLGLLEQKISFNIS